MSSVQGRRRRGSGHELREVILKVTTDLLAQLGDVDALKMRAVAAAAGVTPPSLYRHFPDKAALVQTVIATRFAAFAMAIDPGDFPATANPLDRLEAMAVAYVQWGLAQPGHYRLLFSATNAGPAGLGLDEHTEHPGAPTFRALVAAVAACLPSTDQSDAALPLATELWASLHGIVDLRISKPEMPWPDPPFLIRPALAAVRAAADPKQTAPWAWAAVAAFAISVTTTVIVNVPVNLATGRWDPEQPPSDWQRTRARWERFQGIRSWLLLTGFVLVCLAITT